MNSMTIVKRPGFYAFLGLSALVLFFAIVFVFFPYEKFLRIILHEVFSGNHTQVSAIDVRKGIGSVHASRLIVGHTQLEGNSLFELTRARLVWNPLSIAKGSMDLRLHAEGYGGVVKVQFGNLSISSGDSGLLHITLQAIDLDKYPKDRLPWLNGLNGVMDGTINRDVLFSARERQKGTFTLTVKNGVLKDLRLGLHHDLTISFKDLTFTGKIQGNSWTIERAVLNGHHISMQGKGVIEWGPRVDDIKLDVAYQSLSKESPLPGKGRISVAGALWSPKIVVVQESDGQKEQSSSSPTK